MKSFFSKASTGAKGVANLYKPSTIKSHGLLWRIGLFICTILIIIYALMFWWSRTPSMISANDALVKYLPESHIDANGQAKNIKTGAALTAMTAHLIDTLVSKNGGYIRNDITPPGIMMDNVPEWEYGVLRNLRDVSKVFRNSFATSGSQTILDNDLAELENKLSINSTQWIFPSAEGSYSQAGNALISYFNRINDEDASDAQFYARADNLRSFLNVVSPNLGSYSQRLSESVGKVITNTSLAGDISASQTTQTQQDLFKKTPWYKIDNTFYEARGYTWALAQQMRAIKVDFKTVLEKKNAMAYVDQLIKELEATQKTVWSPVILNGGGFGVVTNHSLVMASYFSRANAIIIELSALLERG